MPSITARENEALNLALDMAKKILTLKVGKEIEYPFKEPIRIKRVK